tara:strand:+ start:182 stop:466 length:285 start_codon:yes stop_codon:yes gene_type:complete
MKVKQALEITKTMGYTVPEDMTDEAMLYWSKSKNDYVSILDMDLVHVVRSLHKLQIKTTNYIDAIHFISSSHTNIQGDLDSLNKYIEDLRSEYE